MASVDLGALRRRARETEDREAFETVHRWEGVRIGVGVRLPERARPRYFIEVVLDPAPRRPLAGHGEFGRTLTLSERLRGSGYGLRMEEDGCLSGERECSPRDVPRVVDELRRRLRRR